MLRYPVKMSPDGGELSPAPRSRKAYLVLGGLTLLFAAGALLYSQTHAFTWDEGFHLLAAKLIKTGKRPYVDFFFPQTPLNAYWNALWMRILGESWRAIHGVAALVATVAVFLTAEFSLRCFPEPRWRFAVAVASMFAGGTSVLIVQYGTISQAYPFCTLMLIAAFRMAVPAVGSASLWMPAAGGFFAGAAAAASLLGAPGVLILLLWLVIYNRAGLRIAKAIAFLAGAIVPFIPVLLLALQGRRQVIFNILDYHLYFREVQWSGAWAHDFGLISSSINSAQALLLFLLGAGGLLFAIYRTSWSRAERAPYYLCAWLVLGETLHILRARPTFEQYFILTVPFLAMLAPLGLYALGSRLVDAERPALPVAVFAVLFSCALAKKLYDEHDDLDWADMEETAHKVVSVTPPGKELFADELVYFLTRRTPPPGLEHADAHKLTLPPALASLLHVVPQDEVARRIHAGYYATVEICDDERIEKLELKKFFKQQAEMTDCSVFWDWSPK